jgi:hypothetical protein
MEKIKVVCGLFAGGGLASDGKKEAGAPEALRYATDNR